MKSTIATSRGIPGQPLDSDGYRFLSGVNVAFTRLFWVNSAPATCSRDCGTHHSGHIRTCLQGAADLASDARSIDVNLIAEQIVTQTSPTTATGIIADLVQVAVDYEFRRNVVVTVAGSRELDKFVADFRRDNVYVVRVASNTC